MPTIKTKKEMNLPELIEWGFRNNIENESYKTNDAEGYELYFDAYGTPRFSSLVNKNDIFAVEIEEEITEVTVMPKLLTIFKSNPLKLQDDRGKQRAFVHSSESIQYILNKAKSQRENIDTIHIINDDNTHTLIWKNGKLVE